MKGSVKKLRWFLLGGVGLLGLAFFLVFYSPLLLSDLRPKDSKPSLKSQQWYRLALKAHGGYERWQSIKRSQVQMTAIFSNALLRRALGPFRENQVELKWDYTPTKAEPVKIAELRDGKTQRLFVQALGKTSVEEAGQQHPEPNRLRFFVRAIRHLLDFVFAMKTADIVHDAGEATWKGQRYVRIFMTWKDARPNRYIDQYVLWINKKTHLMDRFDCTGRQVVPWVSTPFIVARVEFDGYQSVQGFAKPASIMVYRGPTSRQLVHGYKIHAASYALVSP